MIAIRNLLILPLLALCLTLRAADIDITAPVQEPLAGFTYTTVATGLNVPQSMDWTLINDNDFGAGDLVIYSVGTSNAVGVSNLSITGLSGATIAMNQSRNFIINYTPIAASFQFSVSIFSNDGSDTGAGEFKFTIRGTVNPNPNIIVTRDLIAVSDGGADNLGIVAHTFTQRLSYTIRNTGINPLVLSGFAPPVNTLTAGTRCNYRIISAPAAINGGSTGTMVVDVTPTDPGVNPPDFTAAISFSTNDPDIALFNFTINGGITAPLPEITITRSGNNINTGLRNQLSGAAKNEVMLLSYTISNTGFATLNFTNPTIGATLVNCTATISQAPAVLTLAAPANSAEPALSTTFVVALTPTDKGDFSFTIELPATINDADESTFSIVNFGRALNEARPAGDEPPCGLGSGVGVLLLAAFGFLLVGGRPRH